MAQKHQQLSPLITKLVNRRCPALPPPCQVFTCQDDDYHHGEDVWVLGQHSWRIHGHVFPAELLDVLPDDLVERRAPGSGHAGGPWERKKRTGVTFCSCHTPQKQGTLHSFWPRQLSKAASESSPALGARVRAEFPLQTQPIASQGEGPHCVFFSPLEHSKPQPVLKAPALISAKAISRLRLML